MGCERFREAVSARLDGETPGMDETLLDRHLEACLACAAYSRDVTKLNGLVRVSEAPTIPDRTGSIMHRLGSEEVDWSRRRWRVVLACLAGAKLATGVPALVAGFGGAESLHAMRELAAWEVALAVALLLAAWQPLRATGLFPLVGVVVAVMMSVAIVDVAAGRASLVGEAHHLIELVGLVGLGRLSGPMRSMRAAVA